MRLPTFAAPLALVLVLAAGAGCASPSTKPITVSGATPTVGQPSDTPTTAQSSKPPVTTTSKPPTSSWPSPEDCISYNPNNVTVHYEAGIYQVSDGSTVVMRLPGGPGENVGDKGLALAQRYSKHCFIGRNNTREEHNSFVFDYWRNASGAHPDIPGQEDDCSSYDKGNLTVEDMGGGDGWRVKDHDHVLHLFDNQTDAKNGKLVLAKYSQICFIGNDGSDDPDQVSYSL